MVDTGAASTILATGDSDSVTNLKEQIANMDAGNLNARPAAVTGVRFVWLQIAVWL